MTDRLSPEAREELDERVARAREYVTKRGNGFDADAMDFAEALLDVVAALRADAAPAEDDEDELEPGELRPCPFCGGEAEILHFTEGQNAGGSCVSCKICLASSNVEFEFKEHFVGNWNSRAARAAGQEGG